jgi:hypothetical protein
MTVFLNGKQIVIETNIAWALPYWTERKRVREKDGVRITWRMNK